MGSRSAARCARESNIPIIMLTAKGDEVDRVIGLEMGADDYLPKPFGSRELIARIKAVLRRSRTKAATASPESSDPSATISIAGAWTPARASSFATTASRCRSAPANTIC